MCWPRATRDAAAPTFSPDGLYFLGPLYDAAGGACRSRTPAYDCAAMTHAERTRIKVCGLTREQDVDAAVAAGVDAVGFVLYAPSPRAVTPERAAQLAARLPPFVTPVLLFVNETATCDSCQRNGGRAPCCNFMVTRRPSDCWAASGRGARPYLRAARIPLGGTGFGLRPRRICP
jgi:phosphoribosylanthranilate isomerase